MTIGLGIAIVLIDFFACLFQYVWWKFMLDWSRNSNKTIFMESNPNYVCYSCNGMLVTCSVVDSGFNYVACIFMLAHQSMCAQISSMNNRVLLLYIATLWAHVHASNGEHHKIGVTAVFLAFNSIKLDHWVIHAHKPKPCICDHQSISKYSNHALLANAPVFRSVLAAFQSWAWKHCQRLCCPLASWQLHHGIVQSDWRMGRVCYHRHDRTI